jgi:hypothetical protein
MRISSALSRIHLSSSDSPSRPTSWNKLQKPSVVIEHHAKVFFQFVSSGSDLFREDRIKNLSYSEKLCGPVDCGEMPLLRQPLVEPPERAGEAQARLRNRFRKSPPAGDTALITVTDPARSGSRAPGLVPHAHNTAQAGTQDTPDSPLRRAFPRVFRRFPGVLRPSVTSSRHNGDVISHVTIIFCNRHSEIYACFARSDGHVRSIRDQHEPFHKGRVMPGIAEFGELFEKLSHFVSSFAAADIYD